MLKPSSPLRISWDVVSIFLVGYISISLPYRLSFLSDVDTFGLTVFDFLIDVFFLCDIAINFRTAYILDGGPRWSSDAPL